MKHWPAKQRELRICIISLNRQVMRAFVSPPHTEFERMVRWCERVDRLRRDLSAETGSSPVTPRLFGKSPPRLCAGVRCDARSPSGTGSGVLNLVCLTDIVKSAWRSSRCTSPSIILSLAPDCIPIVSSRASLKTDKKRRTPFPTDQTLRPSTYTPMHGRNPSPSAPDISRAPARSTEFRRPSAGTRAALNTGPSCPHP